VREAGEQWAQDAGVGVIDVAAAFAGSDADEDLLLDELHPNAAGQELWAQVVTDALD
jgi:lysophospholipase L1-like esterase